MKFNIALSLFLCFLASCAAPKMTYNIYSEYIDYSKYTEKGFFISELTTADFEYTSMGRVYTEATSGYEEDKRDTIRVETQHGTPYLQIRVKFGDWKSAHKEDVLDLLYKVIVSRGGNGVIDLKFGVYPAEYNNNGVMIRSGVVYVTGIAIKRGL